ncbi:hypothetical protein AGRA3207_002014 [Actinomadura graeca]|uniref:Uncharacterized protein n=1 Tax=Actinomadura graeca TaxID=2750812 RepID=A0ABX8QSL7_9ACTN|nr:hypothetical protein [Actinomadura graeca]QXJ21184.1 hypothetical protein AGRA3207_002014 [Actinomadura graeca]
MVPGPHRNLPPSLLSQRIRTLAVLLGPALALVLIFVLASRGGGPWPRSSLPGAFKKPGKAASAIPDGPFGVSYGGAAARLADLPKGEDQEQIRDWLRTALAAHLRLDTAHYRPAALDTAPVRDEGLADMTAQPTGPGRALFDERDGRLHLLLPAGDRYEPRTIALLLDQHRTDHGSDPRSVQIHHYTDDARTQTIKVGADAARPPEQVRAANGYVTMRVDRPGGLRDFLSRTRHLSRLERKGQEIWAGGWKWRAGSAPPLTMADVTAIQRGYLKETGRLPAFSLDPPKSAAGLQALEQGGLYHQARYEGGLRGTEVGMTLFYTDLVAKLWVNGIGSGVPDKAVQGFVPDPAAVVPLGHCPAAGTSPAEHGRLWFGQNQAGFLFEDDHVEIGARATRLFMRTSAADGRETDSSYGFGRGLRWWDAHFQEVADYEPQYSRLEEIMRWSAAAEWLGAEPGGPHLPQLGDHDVRDDQRFRTWHARHSELRERSGFTFVGPPSSRRETLSTKGSKPYEYCGHHVVSGGVSLADTVSNMKGGTWRSEAVPVGDRRGGLYEPSSQLDAGTGKGRITQVWVGENGRVVDRLERRFSTTGSGASVVETIGKKRRSESFGRLKVLRGKGTQRSLRIERGAKDGFISESIAVEGRDWGRLEADAGGGWVLLRWVKGPLDRVRRALQSAQDGSEPAPETVLYSYNGSYKVGGKDAPWLEIVKDGTAPGGDMAFRLGRPRPGGSPEFLVGRFTPPPGRGPSAPRGPPPGTWLEFRPERPGGPVVAFPVHPSRDAQTMRVETTDGRATRIHVNGKRAQARLDDPIVGFGGPEAGAALLRDFPRVAEARNEAVQARDGMLRGVRLGDDGVALVGADKTIIAGPGEPFGRRVLQALGLDLGRSRPLIAIESGHPVHHGRGEVVPGARRGTMDLSDLASLGDNVLVSDRMRSLVLHDGAIIPNWMDRNVKVTVREGTVAIDPATESTIILADSYRQGPGGQRTGSDQSRTWLRATGPGVRAASVNPGPRRPPGWRPGPGPQTTSPSPSPVPTGPGQGGPGAGLVLVPVVLACLDEDTPDPACAS